MESQIVRLLPQTRGNVSFADLNIPVGDKGVLGERDDYSIRGEFLERFEHLSRYQVAREQQWKRIVELGCGTGYGSSMLADASEVIAFDISQPSIVYADKVHPGPDYVVGSATAIPLRDEVAEAIVSFEMIEHLQDTAMFLDECRRILRKGGTLLLSSPNPGYLPNFIKKKLLGKPLPIKIWAGNIYHVREFSFDEMTELLNSKDFEVKEAFGQTLPIPFIRVAFTVVGLTAFHDWLFSRLGKNFPRISFTVIYRAVKM